MRTIRWLDVSMKNTCTMYGTEARGDAIHDLVPIQAVQLPVWSDELSKGNFMEIHLYPQMKSEIPKVSIDL